MLLQHLTKLSPQQELSRSTPQSHLAEPGCETHQDESPLLAPHKQNQWMSPTNSRCSHNKARQNYNIIHLSTGPTYSRMFTGSSETVRLHYKRYKSYYHLQTTVTAMKHNLELQLKCLSSSDTNDI